MQSTVTSTGAGSSDIRRHILELAEARFQQYGFRKTTMAEIAEDAGMSPANLYRYFDNKQALCADCARGCMGRRVEVLRQLVRTHQGTAHERLREFALRNIDVTLELVAEQPHIHELVQSISDGRPDLVRETLKVITGLITEILEHGNRSGEFDVADTIGTASAVHVALMLFEVPLFTQIMSREQMRASAEQLVAVLVRGLRST